MMPNETKLILRSLLFYIVILQIEIIGMYKHKKIHYYFIIN
jgi:hypothetical protein